MGRREIELIASLNLLEPNPHFDLVFQIFLHRSDTDPEFIYCSDSLKMNRDPHLRLSVNSFINNLMNQGSKEN